MTEMSTCDEAILLCEICRRLHTSASVTPLALCYFFDLIKEGWKPDETLSVEIMIGSCILLACKELEEGHRSRDVAIAVATSLITSPNSFQHPDLTLGLVPHNMNLIGTDSLISIYDCVRSFIGKGELILLRFLKFNLQREHPLLFFTTWLQRKFELKILNPTDFQCRSIFSLILTGLTDDDVHFELRKEHYEDVLEAGLVISSQLLTPNQIIEIKNDRIDRIATLLLKVVQKNLIG
ncbi:hypothetical protein RCL1_004534 [Eukaryota sp. TZLM3-RCL]